MKKIFRILIGYIIIGQLQMLIYLQFGLSFRQGTLFGIIVAGITDRFVVPYITKSVMSKIEISIVNRFSSSKGKKGNVSVKQTSSQI